MKNNIAIWIGIGVLATILIWGFIGAAQADEPGVTCNTGIGDSLCWSWEQNLFGDFQEFANDISDQDDSEQ